MQADSTHLRPILRGQSDALGVRWAIRGCYVIPAPGTPSTNYPSFAGTFASGTRDIVRCMGIYDLYDFGNDHGDQGGDALVGKVVQLTFNWSDEMLERHDDGPCPAAENMWVFVDERHDLGFTGVLVNAPFVPALVPGATVHFREAHVRANGIDTPTMTRDAYLARWETTNA